MNTDVSPAVASDWCWIGKLAPPLTLLTSLPRQALLAALHARTRGPLVLLVAPAGYGKTTLLMQRRQALLSNTPSATVAWLSLDEADGDPNRFLSYLILTLDRAGLDLGHLTRLAHAQALDVQPHRTITALLHAFARENRRVTLFLDDYHTAANAALDALVQALLEQAAPWLEWVVSARVRPGWPLAQWKANGWVHEVFAQALRFTQVETSEILGPTVAPSAQQHLHEKTEGWPVAVQLARLWCANGDASLYGLNAFSGCSADMADYLTGQVVQRLPQDSQDFLRDMALLERFNPELADAVRGRSDSAQQLMQLVHLDALLVPLDADRQWFRQHRLLQDFLNQRIDASVARDIHYAAAQWLAEESDWVQAITYALRASDTRLAVQLVVRAGSWEVVLHKGIRYAQSLLGLFDEKTRREEPDLLLLQAYLHAKLGDHALATQLLYLAHGRVEDDPRLARDFHVIHTLANAYTDRFEPHHCAGAAGDDVLAQGTLECVHALQALTQGRLPLALQVIRSAHIKMRLAASPRGENYCRIHEAQVLALGGDLSASAQMVDNALAIADSQFGSESSVRALVGCLKAQHLYWQGAWAEAIPWFRDGWASLKHTDGWLDIAAATAEVTWRSALRNLGLQPALLELEHTAQLASARNWQRLERLVRTWRVDLLVQGGSLTQARQEALAANLDHTANNAEDWRNLEAATLALARFQFATGASGAALNRLQQGVGVLQPQGLRLPTWRLQVLTLAAHGKGHAVALDATLASIPATALPGLLLEAGPCVLAALEACTNSRSRPPAVLTRLRGWRAHPVRPRTPFSAKETQILALLAEGQSNKAIAQAMDISENTVKFHLKHVFAKLGVDNRTAAMAAALRLGMLTPFH
ncbi:LuxR C-terminal-related transcriptional regulator [Pseudomonas sp.]|uniref:LuxR C-terminal-related transcriptional regulator n=1 Tax=Pseudomonas sp. TaxID=306 RepID=UPI002587E8D0|nr:LuxR C-terminal-related transcriptional regulator [Pseudomonas sp.]